MMRVARKLTRGGKDIQQETLENLEEVALIIYSNDLKMF